MELQREHNQTLATEFKVLDLAVVTVTWISGGQIPEDSWCGDALVPSPCEPYLLLSRADLRGDGLNSTRSVSSSFRVTDELGKGCTPFFVTGEGR